MFLRHRLLSRFITKSHRKKQEIVPQSIPTISDGGSSRPSYSPFTPGQGGFIVPSRFRINTERSLPRKEELTDPVTPSETAQTDTQSGSSVDYTSFTGLRFPTLTTGENFRYFRERGLSKLAPKIFPIHVPTYSRLHPLLRRYMAWLHQADPGRWTVGKLAERYGVKERSVAKVLRREERDQWLRERGLGGRKFRQVTKEEKIAIAKEREFAKKVGYEVIPGQDLEEPEMGDGDFVGVGGTSDFVRLQQIEVEGFQAVAVGVKKRNPVPKRVDVDVLVGIRSGLYGNRVKVVNWVDANDRVVF